MGAEGQATHVRLVENGAAQHEHLARGIWVWQWVSQAVMTSEHRNRERDARNVCREINGRYKSAFTIEWHRCVGTPDNRNISVYVLMYSARYGGVNIPVSELLDADALRDFVEGMPGRAARNFRFRFRSRKKFRVFLTSGSGSGFRFFAPIIPGKPEFFYTIKD